MYLWHSSGDNTLLSIKARVGVTPIQGSRMLSFSIPPTFSTSLEPELDVWWAAGGSVNLTPSTGAPKSDRDGFGVFGKEVGMWYAPGCATKEPNWETLTES